MTATSIRVVLDHPHAYFGYRVWRRLSGFIGAFLIAVGLTASIPAVPATIAVIGLFIGWATTGSSEPNPWPADFPVAQVVLAWAVLTPIAIAGLKGGLRLLRGNRTVILFLRRFGHDDAQSAMTFAVLQTIGAYWRVVTLDDAEMHPIGIPVVTRDLFRVGRFTSKSLLGIGQFVGLRMFPILLWAMWGIVALALARTAIEYARTGTTRWEDWNAVLEPYLRILASVLEWNFPFAAVEPTLPGLFAVVGIAAAVSFGALIATMAVLMLAVPLSTVLFFLSSSADAVREAERSKTLTVTTADEIQRAANSIARRSRQVFGPRLVVLRVASEVWTQAVRQLASVCSRTVIDVSEPTENVLWELEELLTRHPKTFVVIGHQDRVAALASADPGLTHVERRLAALLAGREVLAYTTDRQGLKRFACALRGHLIALDASRSRLSPVSTAQAKIRP